MLDKCVSIYATFLGKRDYDLRWYQPDIYTHVKDITLRWITIGLIYTAFLGEGYYNLR
jgi:hypothetical protein